MKRVKTLKFRTDEGRSSVYRRAAARRKQTFSAWVRYACDREAQGVIMNADTRKELLGARMMLNRISDRTAADKEVALLLQGACSALDGILGLEQIRPIPVHSRQRRNSWRIRLA